jgi:hypothetical protein
MQALIVVDSFKIPPGAFSGVGGRATFYHSGAGGGGYYGGGEVAG